MPKVSVTIKDGRTVRTYEDDYAFVMALHESAGSPEGRWVELPENWKSGMGMFMVGIRALGDVAALPGNERFKVAARAAIDAINGLSPKESDDESSGKNSKRSAKSRGKKQRDGRVSGGGCEGSECLGCSCDDAAADACGEGDGDEGGS